MSLDFPWAVNVVKLQAAKDRVQAAHNLDPRVEISEENIKAEYIKLAGKVLDVEDIAVVAAGGKPRRSSKK